MREDTYEITFADSEAVVTATGAELMSAGVSLTLDEETAALTPKSSTSAAQIPSQATRVRLNRQFPPQGLLWKKAL